MRTETLTVDPDSPDPAIIARAAEAIRTGKLVAFPTETVYGLGADALDADAVAHIFTAKGRPAINPLIVHVADKAAALKVVADWPETADCLADRFWPGPLSLVLPKRAHVPDVVTGGGPTVAVRVPAHRVALALLRAARTPIAAPSANRSNLLSPTQAAHVLRGLDGRIEMLLDAGRTAGGIESTVLDLTVSPPRILRPGLLTRGRLEEAVGPVSFPEGRPADRAGPARSPGTLGRHYAPRAALQCALDDAWRRAADAARSGERVGLLTFDEQPEAPPSGLIVVRMPSDAAGYGAKLFDALHRLDEAGVERIVVALPPETDDWLAVHDRLERASLPPT